MVQPEEKIFESETAIKCTKIRGEGGGDCPTGLLKYIDRI
jgi:hypothetical protein